MVILQRVIGVNYQWEESNITDYYMTITECTKGNRYMRWWMRWRYGKEWGKANVGGTGMNEFTGRKIASGFRGVWWVGCGFGLRGPEITPCRHVREKGWPLKPPFRGLLPMLTKNSEGGSKRVLRRWSRWCWYWPSKVGGHLNCAWCDILSLPSLK